MTALPLASLDDFLVDAPSGRRITRELRRALFERGSLLACGDADVTRRFVLQLAETFPDREAHVLAIDDRGPRTGSRDHWFEAPGHTVSDLLRAALRQDPDAIATALADATATELLLNAAFTGHALLTGVAASSAPDAWGQLEKAVAPDLGSHLGVLGKLTIELDSKGIVALFTRSEGVLERTAWRDGDHYAFAAPPAPPSVDLPEEARTVVRVRTNAQPAPTFAPRPSWLAITGPDQGATTKLGARRVLLAAEGTWPICHACAAPLAHVLQLDLATLPEPLTRTEGLAQLFVCTQGCDTSAEDAPGTHCRVVTGPFVETPAPEGIPALEVLQAGDVIGWARRDEDPSFEDRPGAEFDDETTRAWHCDKLGGWPAWAQGAEWPSCPDCASRLELIFSLCDAADLLPGTAPRWDDDRAEALPGEPSVRVFDPVRPVHFPGLFTHDADAFLFRCPTHPARLAFRWQTG